VTVSRPRVLRAGDDVRYAGGVHCVEAVSGSTVRLVDVVGAVSGVPLAQLLGDPTFELLSSSQRPAPLPPSGLLDEVQDSVARRARWWERHIVEVLTGLLPEHEIGAKGKPAYDPQRNSLRQRELSKVAELGAAGHQVSITTVKRLRLAYEKEGIWAWSISARPGLESPPAG